MSPADAVIVTGCSSGIGRATAVELLDHGYRVFATARKPDTITDLAERGCRTLALDVTDEESMAAAVGAVEAEAGFVAALVNNAGYAQPGAVETVPVELLRRQFETNVIGLVRMCQLVLPGMRREGRGHIVNIGSMGGKLTIPGFGAYHASKYAVESLSDALRYEVSGFGIKVALIEPGLIKSGFAAATEPTLDGLAEVADYDDFNRESYKGFTEAYEMPAINYIGGTPAAVAKVVHKALRSASPRPRYTVTVSAKIAIAQHAILPDRMWDKALRTLAAAPPTGVGAQSPTR